MSRQRKQKLSVREYEEAEMPRTPVRDERKHDPFLHQGISSPAEIPELLGDSPSLQCDLSPSYLSMEDVGNMVTFLDVMPDRPWDEAASLENSPYNRVKREIFQDLRHTSTPKTSVLSDSGIQMSSSRSSRKRIRYTEDGESLFSKHSSGEGVSVLHDITSSCGLNTKSANSFINIMNNSSVDCDTSGSENLLETGGSGKRFSIIRKNLVDKRRREKEFSGPLCTTSKEEQDRFTYYSGIKNYDRAASLLGTLLEGAVAEDGLSPLQARMLTLMRLRLKLEWRDLSFRFNTSEAACIRVFERSLSTAASALSHMIPWQRPPTSHPASRRTSSKFIYVHPVYFRDVAVQQVFVCVTNEQCPVLHISQPFGGQHDPLKVLTCAPFAARLASGDVLCYTAVDKSVHCYEVTGKVDTRRVDDAPYKGHIWETTRVVDRLNEFKMFAGKCQAKELDMMHIITVIAALTNYNYTALLPQP